MTDLGNGGVVQIDKDLVAASSTPLVLAILSEGESYGYAILKRVRDVSDGNLEWTDGMLYPLLHRLHRLGYVTQEWRSAAGERRRRYYAITDQGRLALEEHRRQWEAVARVLGGVWGGDGLLPFAFSARMREVVNPELPNPWRLAMVPPAGWPILRGGQLSRALAGA